MHGLARQVQEALQRDPHAGDLYVFRGRSGSLVKILWHDGIGMSLCKAAGARPVHLANARGWRRRFDLRVTACLHAGWNRLEKSPADLAAAFGRLSCRSLRLLKPERLLNPEL